MTEAHQGIERNGTSLINVKRLTLIFFLVISCLLAIYKANSPLTSDEVWSVRVASLDYRSEMSALRADVHPPLYYQLLFVWLRVFGSGERAVRSLSALFYLLSVLAVYGLAKSLYGRQTAFLSATIFMTSPLAILSAQFVRMYSLLSLLSILSTWLYLQFSVKPRSSKFLFVSYVLINVLGTFTHIGFFFVIFGQLVFHLVFYRRTRLKEFLVAFAVSLVPYFVLWAPVLLRQVGTSQQGVAWINKPTVSTYMELLVMYGGVLWLIVPILLYLSWRGRLKSATEFSTLKLRSFPAWLLGFTILTPLIISQFKPIFNSRLAIVGLHLFALTAAALIGNNKANYLISIELVIVTAVGLFMLHPGFSRCDNRATASFLNSTTQKGDVVIFTSLTRLPIDYYMDQIANRNSLFETSFPAEIDSHPGYEGRITEASRKAALEVEAKELVEKIDQLRAAGGNPRIFVLRGFHPDIDSILEKQLMLRFKPDSESALRCDEASPYFKEIIVYR